MTDSLISDLKECGLTYFISLNNQNLQTEMKGKNTISLTPSLGVSHEYFSGAPFSLLMDQN